MPNVRVGDIRPNPFRDIDNYPISETKVEELRASFNTTRVWPNVIARRVDGTVEIAYGHHRLEAARREYGVNFKYPLVIEDLTDDEMFKMMASENMEVYAASAQVVQNTIDSLVKAYAEGKVHLDKPVADGPGGRVRYAPSFLQETDRSGRTDRTYTAETLRAYLGWTSLTKVKNALTALEAIEQGTLERADFEGLTMDQARGVIETVHQAEAATKASHRKRPTRDVVAVTREVAVNAARRGEGRSGIRSHGQQVIEREAPLIKKQPLPSDTVRHLVADISNFWKQAVTGSVPPAKRAEVLKAIAINRNSPSLLALGRVPMAKQTATALRAMAAQANEYADLLDSDTTLEVTA